MEWTPARIRLLRAAGLCLSQDDFAAELGFAKRTVGNAERGAHPPSLALRRALDQAWEKVADGWRYVPETGTARVRLAALEARAHARLRDQRATEDALARADRARDEVRGEDDPGGMLAFPVAKQHYCAATARLWLGGHANRSDAERDAAHAVELYQTDPPEQRRLGELCLVRLDLSAARLGRDDLDGTADGVQDVLAIAAQRRTEPIARRLNQIARALARPRYQTSALALDLHDQIHGFTHSSVPPAPPGASG